MSMAKVIKIARGEVGVNEYPANSNRTKYGAEYGLDGQPWCVMFLWWCFVHGDENRAFFNGGRTASCTTLRNLHRAEGRWFTDGKYEVGDIALMNFTGTGTTDHCGLIVEVGPNYYRTVEGNTSSGTSGSQDNGGAVCERVRYKKNIVGVCRPAYSRKEDPPEMPKDYEGRWSQEAIDFCKSNKIMNGYTDGRFGPEDPLTREQLAQTIYNLCKFLQTMGVFKL